MDDVTVQCPYCFEVQTIEIELDLNGAFVQDCAVCCRPWQVVVSRDGEGLPRVRIDRAQ